MSKPVVGQIISSIGENVFSISEIVKDCKQYGIYILFKGDAVVYVGQGMYPLERIGKHTRDKDFDSFKIIPVTLDSASNIEASLIATLRPSYNKSLPKCDLFVSEKDACTIYSISRRKIKELAVQHTIKPINLGKWCYYLRQDICKAIQGGAV